jgi:hypothetical protein
MYKQYIKIVTKGTDIVILHAFFSCQIKKRFYLYLNGTSDTVVIFQALDKCRK